uniref:Uncharacterized protein n=1 Tax=Anguilla anguilla TaxID=7936 RepID=A0A0E9WNP7_ANGAN
MNQIKKYILLKKMKSIKLVYSPLQQSCHLGAENVFAKKTKNSLAQCPNGLVLF